MRRQHLRRRLGHPKLGHLARKEYNDNKGVSYTYTPGGRLKTRTWQRGQTTDYAYNMLGDLTNVNYSATNTPDVVLAYDRLGRLKSASSTTAGSAYAYTGELLTGETLSESIGIVHRGRSMQVLGE